MTVRQALPTGPFAGAARRSPTTKHRPAIWEGILGTVYAQSDQGQVRYFDYDWKGAREFARVTPERDPRVAKKTREVRCTNDPSSEPKVGQFVLWVRK